jgi:hypothetical protein
MFDTLDEVVQFYRSTEDAARRHQTIYATFEANVESKNQALRDAFFKTPGFGELAFSWHWHLLVQAMPDQFRMVEIGVYKGRVLAQVGLAATQQHKTVQLFGVTPLSTIGDKYSDYDPCDYMQAIHETFRTFGLDSSVLSILKGYSTDHEILRQLKCEAPFDIMFVDGCHDYEVVCQDIRNGVALLKPGGFFVMDDASLDIPKPAGRFYGHPDVARAIKDELESRTDLQHLYAVGHNRVWQKK